MSHCCQQLTLADRRRLPPPSMRQNQLVVLCLTVTVEPVATVAVGT